MARGVNKAIIVGTLGKDPDIKFTAGGAAIANFSVATNEKWKDKNTGEQMEKTEWHRLVAFGKLADVIAKYLKKGSQVYTEGKIQTRKWQDANGQDRYSTEIVVNELQMMGGRPAGSGQQQGGQQQQNGYQQNQQQQNGYQQNQQQQNNGYQQHQQNSSQPQQRPASQQQPQQQTSQFSAPPTEDDGFDDIPF